MPAHRTTMRKTREILRLRWHLGQSVRATARSCGVAGSTILDLESRAKAAGLSWPLADDVDDAALEALLYKREAPPPGRELPDFASIHRELRRKGVTLELLWLEYKERCGRQAYSYSRFCELYGKWRGTLDVVMRQSHRAGEKLFVDWAGQTLPLTNPHTGEVTEQPIFVAALGASNYTYAEAARSQESACWLMAHVRAFEFFGGVTEVVVPDNLKTGVTKACFYEPSLNKAYVELAEHYGTTILPTRVAKPKDKPKVENAVQQVERWVLAPLRDHTFFSLAEMNAAMAERLAWLNDREFSRLLGTRRSLYTELDRPALRPLPAKRFEPADWKVDVGVGIDHHIVFDKHYYSVPHELVGKRVDVRAGFLIVEIFYKGRRVTSHRRSAEPGRYTTDDSHRPKAHQRYLNWTPERMIAWARSIGEQTATVVEHVLATKPHPEQGFRSCLGIIGLARKFGNERVEAACTRARKIGAPTYTSIKSILAAGLDQRPLPEAEQTSLGFDHENVRGSEYYH